MPSKETRIQVLIIILEISLSLGIPVWIQIPKDEQSIWNLLLIMLFLLIDILVIARNSYDKLSKDHELWSIQNETDKELFNIRTHFAQIVQNACGEKDLFVNHFKKEIHKLANTIKNMAERRELFAQADHFLSVDNVLDVFQGDKQKIWRYTCLIDGKRLFDIHPWKSYFHLTADMHRKKKIKKIQTLFIVTNSKRMEDLRFKKLLDYYHNNKMEAKIIGLNDYRSLCENNSIQANRADFGIYGNRLLYITHEIDDKTLVVKGTFIKDPHCIQEYTEFFDKLWDSCHVSSNPSKGMDKITLEELFEFDNQAEEVKASE